MIFRTLFFNLLSGLIIGCIFSAKIIESRLFFTNIQCKVIEEHNWLNFLMDGYGFVTILDTLEELNMAIGEGSKKGQTGIVFV